MWLCLFLHVDSSAVQVQWPVWALRRKYLMVWSPLGTSPPPAPRTVTVMLPLFHLWIPPAHLHHLTPHLPVQPVKASGCSAGQVAPLPWNNQKRWSPPQAWPLCSNFSTRKRLFPLLQRPTYPLEMHLPHVHPPLMETQMTSTTSQTHLHPRTVITSPSPPSPPSLTLLPSIKRKSPLTRRMQCLYVYTNLHHPHNCLYFPCSWVNLHTYIIIRVSWLMSGCVLLGFVFLCEFFHVFPQEMNSHKDSEPEQSPTHSTEVYKKPSTLRSKVKLRLRYTQHFANFWFLLLL